MAAVSDSAGSHGLVGETHSLDAGLPLPLQHHAINLVLTLHAEPLQRGLLAILVRS